jgi:hypothetical protein
MTSAIGWHHEKRFFMTSAIGWRHKKRFFMTSANGWRHKKRFFMTSAIGWRHEDVSQWLRDTIIKHKFQTKGIIPLLKCDILFCSRFLTQGRMFTNDTAILVERMLEWNGGFIIFKRHSFCSNFRGETSYSHVHHAENRTRGMSFLAARIRESRWQ